MKTTEYYIIQRDRNGVWWDVPGRTKSLDQARDWMKFERQLYPDHPHRIVRIAASAEVVEEVK